MKKLFQIVALAVVALLAVQPALAGLPCATGVAAANGCAPDCGMAMSQMSPAPMPQMSADCGMQPQISGNDCARNCCGDRVSQSFAQPVSGEKASVGGTMDFVPAAQTIAVATPVFAHALRAEYESTAPPRYILFQVFRV